ncbi:hypothetical protein HPB47_020904 [Ixodes persulcatus]|uniref:Uncharacterized protein n=1 Tax=Ixodes persulcatus TaxID=34615 RepID=A0AC60QDY3_IXOPE|nr:hypothetical protein HPB47_020904 [Ixodes persulcatus]
MNDNDTGLDVAWSDGAWRNVTTSPGPTRADPAVPHGVRDLAAAVALGLALYALSLTTLVGNAMVLHAIRTERTLQTVTLSSFHWERGQVIKGRRFIGPASAYLQQLCQLKSQRRFCRACGVELLVALREIHEAGEESLSEDPGNTLDYTAHRRQRHVYEVTRNDLKSPGAIKSQGYEELEHWGQWQAATALACFRRQALEEAYDDLFRETISHEELPVIEMFQRIKSVPATSSRHIDDLVGVSAVVKNFVRSQQEVAHSNETQFGVGRLQHRSSAIVFSAFKDMVAGVGLLAASLAGEISVSPYVVPAHRDHGTVCPETVDDGRCPALFLAPLRPSGFRSIQQAKNTPKTPPRRHQDETVTVLRISQQ